MLPNKLDGQSRSSVQINSTSIVNIYYYVFRKEYLEGKKRKRENKTLTAIASSNIRQQTKQ